MKVYIAGKITGLPLKECEEKFSKAENIIDGSGHKAINPMKVIPYTEGLLWRDYMKTGLKALLDCDAIYMLKDWQDSDGAKFELEVAFKIGLQIIHETL